MIIRVQRTDQVGSTNSLKLQRSDPNAVVQCSAMRCESMAGSTLVVRLQKVKSTTTTCTITCRTFASFIYSFALDIPYSNIWIRRRRRRTNTERNSFETIHIAHSTLPPPPFTNT